MKKQYTLDEKLAWYEDQLLLTKSKLAITTIELERKIKNIQNKLAQFRAEKNKAKES